MLAQHANSDESRVVSVFNPEGKFPVLIVCEHASNHIPETFGDLGLPDEARDGHIAWDPGAREVSEQLARLFDSPLVVSEVSRLVYDCNRPPEAADAIVSQTELDQVPGYVGLDESQRALRVERIYRPFEQCVSQTLANIGKPSALVTIHSFTPVFFGKQRSVELGILHDDDSRLGSVMLQLAPRYTGLNTHRNQPYGPEDGVTHTLKVHGIANGILNVMIEIRSDLIANATQCLEMATVLHGLMAESLRSCGFRETEDTAKA